MRAQSKMPLQAFAEFLGREVHILRLRRLMAGPILQAMSETKGQRG